VPPTIIVTGKDDSNSQTVDLSPGERLVLGRDPSSPISLKGPNISREHIALLFNNGRLVVEDLSSNGTWVNGKRSPRGAHTSIQMGDLIEIPGYRIETSLPIEQGLPSAANNGSDSTQKQPAKLPWLSPVYRVWSSLEGIEILAFLTAICSLCLIILYALS
jgi:pSer/pThr/pTyr-binding forkhead associated (FHA) protein